MKIAFFSKHLPSDEPNGVSVQVHRLAQALVALGHQLRCFSFSPAPEDARYLSTQLAWPRNLRGIGKKMAPAVAFRNVDTQEYDVVHYHGDDYLCSGSARRVRTFYGSALREAAHAKQTGRFLYQSLFYLFELVSCMRQGTFAGISRDTLRCLPGVKNHIPCGVPLSEYSPGGFKTPYPSVLFIGDLHSRKRGGLLVEAFQREILPAFPDARLTIVGPQPCSGEGVRYAGRCTEKELIDEYRRSWVYCLPSSYEGFGVPAIEAMACGTAVVATVNSGVSEILSHGVNGMQCTPDTLGETLKLVLTDEPLRVSLETAGKSTARQYDSSAIARRYERLYETIGR